MFEKTKAAISKAKEHLAVAEILAQSGYFDQAYFHAAIALEESAVAGIRLVTESGIIDWRHPPPWFKLKEKDLTRGGMHSDRLRLGLVIGRSVGALLASDLPSLPDEPKAIRAILVERSAELGASAARMLTDPAISDVLFRGQVRKEAALYSTQKDAAVANPPDEAEYRRLRAAVVPFVEHLGRVDFPSEEELAKLSPLFAAIFRGDGEAFDKEMGKRLKESFDEATRT